MDTAESIYILNPYANGQLVNSAVGLVGVSKSFGESSVLRDISFGVAEGEILVLLGASGSGKTTILRLIAGLESPRTGKILLHGRDVTAIPARRRGVGVIFQEYALFPNMNVEQNIAYGLTLRKRSRQEIELTVGRLVEMIHLDEHRKKYPSQLSGGQQQRVAIARALAYEPEVLLFDEPFGALDAQIRTRIRREIKNLLKELKIPSIFITHDQEEALELGDRIAVLNNGKLEQIGTPAEIYDEPATEYVASFVGEANILRGLVRDGRFESDIISIRVRELWPIADDGSARLVFRPEDVFLRPKNGISATSPRTIEALVGEVAFAGAHERVSLKFGLPSGKTVLATRSKREATAFPIRTDQIVNLELTRFRLLPEKEDL